MTEQRRPLRDKKGWAGGSQKRRERLDWEEWQWHLRLTVWSTYGENIQRCDLCEMGVWAVEGRSLKWGWIVMGLGRGGNWGSGRATILGMLSFHIISIIIRIIKKFWLSRAVVKQQSKSECDWKPATLNFLFLYLFFTFSLSFYLSSALISLLSPTSRRAKEQ